MDSNKLSCLEADKLLDVFSYKLSFPVAKGEPVWFITGPNGYGKTTILYIIFSLFNQRFENFADIEFDRLRFVFQDGKSIEIQKSIIPINNTTDIDSDLPENNYRQKLNVSYRYNDGRLLNVATYDLNGDFKVNFSENFVEEAPDANLRLFLNSQKCYWIDEGRLNNFSRVSPQKGTEVRESTMTLRNNQLSGEYNKVRFFLKDDLTLMAGLTEQEKSDATRFVKNLKLFKKVLASYKFEHKELETVPEYNGIRFRLADEKRTIILPENLSSGEQQLIDVFYELIFCAPEDSLVLIDEPETSQHLMWQIKFYDNIKEVANNKSLQVIVATHSPQIFDGRWKISEDLYAQAHNKR